MKPYMGKTPKEVGNFLIDVCHPAMDGRSKLAPRGKAIQLKLQNQYGFQNFFYLTVKPWLAGLGREDVTIRYDGQDKRADFNLFGSQLIWELKHVKDASTQAAVVSLCPV